MQFSRNLDTEQFSYKFIFTPILHHVRVNMCMSVGSICFWHKHVKIVSRYCRVIHSGCTNNNG